MVEEPSHVKQLYQNHVCKIGLRDQVSGFLGGFSLTKLLCTVLKLSS
jgi:hypothetical protein